jgi:peptidoglycan/LPS O-acetylase OafA/YrhL
MPETEAISNTSDSEIAVADPKARPSNVLRDSSADILRGAAIWGVAYVHGHHLLLGSVTPVLSSDAFSWCVPIFVILSGFFGAGSVERERLRPQASYMVSVRRRLGRLLIPYLAYSFVYCIANSFWKHSPKQIVTVDFAGYGWSGQYYFIILFQCAIFLPWLVRFRCRPWMVLCSFAILEAVIFALPAIKWHASLLRKVLDDRFSPFWIPYLLLAIWLHRAWQARLRSVTSPLSAWPMSAIMLLLLACQERIYAALHFNSWVTYQKPLIVALAPFMFIALISMAKSLPGRIQGVFAQLGSYSLGIFCLNPLVIRGVANVVKFDSSRLPVWLAMFILPIMTVTGVVGVCYLICRVLEKCGLRALVR